MRVHRLGRPRCELHDGEQLFELRHLIGRRIKNFPQALIQRRHQTGDQIVGPLRALTQLELDSAKTVCKLALDVCKTCVVGLSANQTSAKIQT